MTGRMRRHKNSYKKYTIITMLKDLKGDTTIVETEMEDISKQKRNFQRLTIYEMKMSLYVIIVTAD